MSQNPSAQPPVGRAPYATPRLRVFGDVAVLTRIMTCSLSTNDGVPCNNGQTKKTM